MSRAALVSIVVELGTAKLTERKEVLEVLARHSAELAFWEHPVEYVLVGAAQPHWALPASTAKAIWKFVQVEAGYYECKNVGARESSGEYAVFWDSDCRPGCGYIQRAIDLLESDADLIAVSGITRYDGSSWLAQLNTVLSFGYLFQGLPEPAPYAALAHNLVIRRERFPSRPFGPYTGRSGGDTALTEFARAQGKPVRLDPGLIIFHEDPSFSLRATLERHLRELFNPAISLVDDGELVYARNAVAIAFWSARHCFRKRYRKLVEYGPAMGFGRLSRACAVPILLLFQVLDLSAVAVLALRRRLVVDWLRYQFGATQSH